MRDRDRPPIAEDSRDFRVLSQEILRHMISDVSRTDFLRTLTTMLLEFSACDAVELRVAQGDRCYRCEAVRRPQPSALVDVARCRRSGDHVLLACPSRGDGLDELSRLIIEGRWPATLSPVTPAGSFWTGNLPEALAALPRRGMAGRGARATRRAVSLALIPVTAVDRMSALLQLRSRKREFFQASDIAGYEQIAQTITMAVISQGAHASLRERVQELTCLYRLAQLAEAPHVPLGEVLQGVVEALPGAWQYPAPAASRIVFDDQVYGPADDNAWVQALRVDLIVRGRLRGYLEVGYTPRTADLDDQSFLAEESSLIHTVARQITLLVERREAAEEQSRLQDQLRHADRLATIGQLSAGVAHELNEPLGNILAFAQLAAKEPGVPPQAGRDLDKIVATSLHAREIIRKLMLFARQMPPRKTDVDINAVVEEGLSLVESRCGQAGVTIVRRLSTRLPRLVADPSQLHQVLVNLAVNAVQAMPDGGALTITTGTARGHVVLSVEDTGVGMDGRVLEKVFTPFFTTKDVHEGTGLGLAVVHGIVSAHGGTIAVRSKPGQGSRFEVRLPMTSDVNDEDGDPHEAAS